MNVSRMSADEHIQLWDNFKAGNPEAFSKLYTLFAPDLYRYGYNMIRNKPLIEDALQELFLSLYNNKHKLGATDNIRFYLYRSFRNRLITLIERAQQHTVDVVAYEHEAFMIKSYEDEWVLEESLHWQKSVMMQELNNLPKRQREVLYLVYIQGMTYKEAAEIMQISPKTVLNGINVALKTLQKHMMPILKRYGINFLFLLIDSLPFK